MQYLIIGAGPAGVNAAETLRQLDPTPRSHRRRRAGATVFAHGDPFTC